MIWWFLISTGSVVASGVGAWLLGRMVLPYRDDPVLPERLESHRKRLGLLVFLPVVVISGSIAVSDHIQGVGLSATVESIPSLVFYIMIAYLAVAIGDLPARRILLGESWSVGEYMGFSFRVIFGLFGFWIVVLLSPFLAYEAGEWRWAVGGLLFLVLVLWSRHYARLAVATLGSVPIESDELVRRFDRIIARSNAPRPEILSCCPESGGWSNAIAFAALSDQPKVVFSNPLLSQLDLEETAAIFAHELAHLEDFDTRYLKRSRMIEWGIVALGCFSVPLLENIGTEASVGVLWGWLPLILVLLILRKRGLQKRETKSDLRAVELCENPEALINGLVKLYAANKLPRRMAIEVESNSSHPSLARRIRDIREVSGAPVTGVASLGDDAQSEAASSEADTSREWMGIFRSRACDTEWLLFGDTHIYWIGLPVGDEDGRPEQVESAVPDPGPRTLLEQAETVRSIAYAGLVEMRLIMKRSGGDVRVVDTKGGITLFAVRKGDEGAVTEALNLTDGQLAPYRKFRKKRDGAIVLAGSGVAACGVLAMGNGALGIGAAILLLLAAIPAAVARDRPTVAAVGGMALIAAICQLLTSPDRVWWGASAYVFLGLTGIAGAWCICETYRHKHRGSGEPSIKPGSPLTVGITYLLVGLIFSLSRLTGFEDGELASRLYSLGLHSKWSFLPFVGAAFAIAQSATMCLRVLALLFLATGISHHWFESEHFLRAVVSDPLAVNVPPAEWRAASYDEARVLSLEGEHWGFRISSDATRFYTIPATQSGRVGYGTTFRISDFSGNVFSLDALALAFAGKGRMVSLENIDDGLKLRLFAFADPADSIWVLSLPEVDESGELNLSVGGDTWRLVSGAGEDRTVRLSGQVGSDFIDRKIWTKHSLGGHYRYLGTGGRLLEVATGGPGRGEPGSEERLFWAFHNFHAPTGLRFMGGGEPVLVAETLLWVDCREGGAEVDRIACMAEGPRHSWGWLANPESGSFQSLLQLGRHFDWDWDGTRIAVIEKEYIRMYFLNSDDGVVIPLPESANWNVNLALADAFVALVRRREADSLKTEISLLRIPVR